MNDTVYVVRHALTKGILSLNKAVYDEKFDLITGFFDGNKYEQIFHKGQWVKTLPDAITLAEAMRVRKIASLKKQLSRLEKLSFEKGNE